MKFTDEYYQYFKKYLYLFKNINPYHWEETICKYFPAEDLRLFQKYFTPLTRGQLNEKLLPGYKGDIENQEKIVEYRLNPDIIQKLKNDKISEEIKTMVRIIRKKMCGTSTTLPDLALSTMYKEVIKFFQFGGVRFFNRTSQGRKSSVTIKMKNKLPACTIIHPTIVGSDETKYLKIPKYLCKVFDIKDNDQYLLGIREGVYSDTLHFFPLKTGRKDFKISQFNSFFIDDTNSAEDESFFELSGYNIYIWREPINVTQRSESAFYFNNVPSFFYMLLEADSMLLNNENTETFPLEPAYVLTYDMVGNLIYHRILYTDKENHDKLKIPAILMSELPSILEKDQNITIDNLPHMKKLIDLMNDAEH